MVSTALLSIHASHWIAAILLLGIAAYGLKFRRQPMVAVLSSFCALAGLWALFSALIFSVPDLAQKVALNRVKLIAPVTLPLSILALAMVMHGKRTWYPYVFGAMAIVPAVSLVMLCSPFHESLVGNYHLVPLAGSELLAFENGSWFFVHNLNARLIAISSIALLFSIGRDVSRTHRYRIWLVILAVAVPFIGDTIAVHYAPTLRYMQMTPTLLLFSALLIIYAAVGSHMVNVVPFARAQILDGLGDLYLIFDEDQLLVDFNAKAATDLQLSRHDLGRAKLELKARSAALEELLEFDGERGEWTLGERVFEVTQHTIQAPGVARVGTVMACKDITTRKAEERSLKELTDIRTKLLAVIGHDFQGNLAASLIIAQSLAKNVATMRPEDVVTACHNLERTSAQNAALVDELLAWAKYGLGASSVQSVTDLHAVMKCIDSFVQPLAKEHDVTLQSEIKAASAVLIDGTGLQVIVRNLVTNAIKASSRAGTVKVHMGLVDGILAIEVRDGGCGISKDRHASLFELNKEKSAGIGLFLCKEFVTRLGGDIRLDSDVGRGSSFFVSLPISPAC